MEEFITLPQGDLTEDESSDGGDGYVEEFIIVQQGSRNYPGSIGSNSRGDDNERTAVCSLFLIGYVYAFYVALTTASSNSGVGRGGKPTPALLSVWACATWTMVVVITIASNAKTNNVSGFLVNRLLPIALGLASGYICFISTEC